MEIKNMSKLQPPILYDSLDRPNAPHPSVPVVHESPWPKIALIVISALFLAGITIFVIITLTQLAAYNGFAFFLLQLFYVTVVCSLILVFIAIAIFAILRAFGANIHNLSSGVPVSMINIWRSTIDTQRAADSYYTVMNTRAKESRFQGVSTLTLDESRHEESSTTTVGATDESEENMPVAKDKSILEDLRDKGHINRSNDSIMVGYSNGNT